MLLSNVEQQCEANEAMERRAVCGAVSELSGVRCSGRRRSTWVEVGGLFPSGVNKRVLRVSERLH